MMRRLSLALICISYAIAASSELSGDHICHRVENYTETVNSTTSEPIQVRKNFWCLEKIRCSELKPDVKEIVETKNVTKTRTVEFCCPNYKEFEENGKTFCRSSCGCVNGNCSSSGKCDCALGFVGQFCEQPCPSNRYGESCVKYCKCGDHKCDPLTGECLKEKMTTTLKPIDKPRVDQKNRPVLMIVPDVNPYRNLNAREFEEANPELQGFDYPDGNEFIYLDTNEVPDLGTPPTHLDQQQMNHHNESMAMVTVGCVVLGILVFLLAMIYIRRITRRRRVDPEEFQTSVKQIKLDPSKIVHAPTPMPPLRPSLRKSKSVTFDDSFDEVDEKIWKESANPASTYDVPKKQSSLTNLNAKAAPMSPLELETSSGKGFNTFPKRISAPNKSLEHIYAEIQSKKA